MCGLMKNLFYVCVLLWGIKRNIVASNDNGRVQSLRAKCYLPHAICIYADRLFANIPLFSALSPTHFYLLTG